MTNGVPSLPQWAWGIIALVTWAVVLIIFLAADKPIA